MSMMSEFKDFAVKGNVMDMAVGVIIGAAFGKIVTSLVSDMIMPLVGKAMGGLDFSKLFINLTDNGMTNYDEALKAGTAMFKHGAFIQHTINFVILAFCVFLMVRTINNMKKKEEEAPAAPAADIQLLTEIRDALKK